MTAHIDELVAQVSSLRDPAARALAIDLVQAVMELHASALQRVLELAPDAAPALAADDLVASILLLHGLHPDDFDTRLARAIDRLQTYFDSRGSALHVLEATPDRVRVRFESKRPGAGQPARHMIEEAIYGAAPEIGELIVEGTGEEGETGFVPVTSLLATP